MINIEKKNDDFYINNKKVVDPLEFTIEERAVLKDFKIKLEQGLKIRSTEYLSKKKK